MNALLSRLQRKAIEKFCLCIITRNNYIVTVFTSTGMVMFSQNLLNTIGTRKINDPINLNRKSHVNAENGKMCDPMYMMEGVNQKLNALSH